MKFLKGILIVFLDLILFCAVFLLIGSFSLWSMKDSLKQEVITEVYDVVESSQGDGWDKMVNDVTDDFLLEHFDDILDVMLYDNESNVDFYEELIQYIKDNEEELEKKIGADIPVEDLDQIVPDDMKNQLSMIGDQISIESSGEFSQQEILMLRIIWFVMSLEFKIIISIVAIIVLLFIALLQHSYYKWVRSFSSVLIINGLLSLAIGFLFKEAVGDALVQDSFDKLLTNNSPFYSNGYVVIIVGVILFIIYEVISYFVKKKKKVIEVK